MAKNKENEALYKAEGLRRMKLRKKRRIENLITKQYQRDKWRCRGCGEDPYCYCGDGTPYSY